VGLNRRTFLKLGAAGAAGGLLFGRHRSARAAPFGDFPEAYRSLAVPEAMRAKRVLEVFLYGGLSPWETLYFVEEYGRPDDPAHPRTQFYALSGTGGDSIETAMTSCGFPDGEPLGVDFAMDGLGANVKLGPFAFPLRARPDLTDRMRLLVQEHDLEPHEAAVPLALTGRRVGNPAQAGLGAHVQRFFLEHPEGTRRSPYSWMFSTNTVPGDNVLAGLSTGMHPGAARPLRIKVDAAERFIDLLARPSAGTPDERARYDQLLSVYVEQYRRRLRHKGVEPALRSPRFAELTQAAASVGDAEAIASVVDPALLDVRPGAQCGDDNVIDIPGMSFDLAAHLLTHPTEPARYVCVVDTGLISASGGGGYDTHTENSHDTARNFKHMLTQLLRVVNAPGEDDPRKIDLDDTLIILNTEFGRTPWLQDGGNGRNHHPWGYVTALLGGPIQPGQKGIVGAIGPDGKASGGISPSENRVAALLALGVFPFSPEAFGVSDVDGAGDEGGAVEIATQRTLGVRP
jgi:hypothetical protein